MHTFFPESIERIIPQPYPAPAYHSTAAEVVEEHRNTPANAPKDPPRP